MVDTLCSGHRLHSTQQVHSFHTQSHLRHNTFDLIRLQLIKTDLVETEELVIYTIVYFLQAHIILMQCIAHKDLIVKHTDCPRPADTPYQIMSRVVVCLDLLRHCPFRSLAISLCFPDMASRRL
jgi:hypothetical protein